MDRYLEVLDVDVTTRKSYDGYIRNHIRPLDGFENFNRQVRQPRGFRIRQPVVNGSFSPAPVAHDQLNTTVYSDDDPYRGVKNLRTLLFLNPIDMAERGIGEFDRIDITASPVTAPAAPPTATAR